MNTLRMPEKVTALALAIAIGATATAHAQEGATVVPGTLKAEIARNQDLYGSPAGHAAGQTGVYGFKEVNSNVITTNSPNEIGAEGFAVPGK